MNCHRKEIKTRDVLEKKQVLFKFYIILIVKLKLLVFRTLINSAITHVEVRLRCYLDDRSKFLILSRPNYNQFCKAFFVQKRFFKTLSQALGVNLTLNLVNPIYTANIMVDLQVCDKNVYFHGKPDV